MLCHILLMTALLGQTTQPAGPAPATRPAPRFTVGGVPPEARTPAGTPTRARPAVVTPAPTTAPAVVVRPPAPAAVTPPATQPAGGASSLVTLSGNVDVQVTSDGNIVLTGDPKDIEVLQEFINSLAAQQAPPPTFRVFKLEGGQAQSLATQLVQFWNNAKSVKGALPPEDKISIMAEPRSNSLMVAASEKNMDEIAQIIEGLQQPGLEMTVYPFKLQYIKAAEAEQTLRDLLKSRGQRQGVQGDLFDIKADVRTNSLLISAPKADIDQIRKLIEIIDVEPTVEAGGVVKLAIFPLEKAVASDLADVLEEMLRAEGSQAKAMEEQIRRLQTVIKTKQGDRELTPLNLEKPIRIIPDPGTNSLIVASIESNLEPIGEIIRLLDGLPMADEMMVKIYPLEHADAEQLSDSIRTIFEQGQQLPRQQGREEIQARVPKNLPGAALAYNIGLAVDTRTNAIVVAGRPEQLVIVEQIVKAVDVQEDANKFPPRVIKLERADSRRLAEGLQRFADQRQQAAERLGPAAAARERITVIADTRTNSLIVVAKDDNYEEIAKLVRQLDTTSPEYLGQVRIINLENLAATEIAEKINELWTGRAKNLPGGEQPYDQPVIVTDTRSNSLVVASNQEDFELISRIVRELEQQKLSPMADIKPLILQHADATKVAEIVRELFEERRKMSLAQGEQEQPSDRITVVEDPTTRTLFIAASKSNYEEVVRVVKQIDVPPVVDGIIRTFTLKNAPNTERVRDMLRELFDGGVYRGAVEKSNLPESATQVTVVADPRSGSIIVSASPENMAIAERFIQEVDKAELPVSMADSRFFQLKNADAVSVANMLDDLLQGIRDAQKTEGDELTWRIIPDTRSNSVIVTGSRYAVRRVEELIPRLDQAATEGSTSEVRVYPLRETSAVRVEPVITRLFETRHQGGGQTERTPITVIADEGSNSLIVTASREDHAALADLLSRIDIRSSLAQQMEIIPLKEAKAEALADSLTKLVEQQRGEVARSSGFAVVPEPRTNSLVVFAPPDLMGNVRSIVEKLDNARPKSEMAVRVFPLVNQKAEELSDRLEQFFEAAGTGRGEETRQLIIKFTHLDPETGESMVRSLVHQDITITPDPTTNSLLVMAPDASIDMMQMLIEMLDSVRPVTAEIQAFTLLNADATEMKDLLDELFTGQGGGGRQGQERRTLILAGEGGGAAGAAAAGPGAAGEGAIEIAFAVDQRTNTLIAAGSPAYLRIVEKLVLQLDYKDIEERTVRVVHLRNAKAEDVATTMRDYFQEESQAIEQAAQEEAAPRQLRRQVTIQDAGETSNTLLLSYSPQMESRILNIISELDQAPPQVMIQVLMAEVTLSENFEMGMEFALQDLVFSENATVGANGTLQGDGKDVIFGTDVGAQGSGGLAGMSFTVTGEDFNFLLRALQTDGRVEVLSRPSILVRDNQEANITIGERVPTVQDITVSAAGVVTPSVTYEEVGVILTVTPIINPDGFVNLEVAPEISAIGTSSVTVATGVTLPTFTQRKAETTVSVKDGETIIIGGLITSRENASENKVPLAGDVPILGNLFRANTKSSTKTELLIVLTPHVIRTPEDAQKISVKMRDQTGLNENIRKSPLMGGLQVTSEQDQFCPTGPVLPFTTTQPAGTDRMEILGPELEEFGPPTTSIELGPQRETIAVRAQ